MPICSATNPTVTSPAGALSAVVLNGGVAAKLAAGWGKVAADGLRKDGPGKAKDKPVPAPAVPAEGQGAVHREGTKPVAVSTVDGTVCKLSAVCTHLGGIVHWNDNERTWDCPLHGSRFTSDGKLLEGPATSDLPRAGTA